MDIEEQKRSGCLFQKYTGKSETRFSISKVLGSVGVFLLWLGFELKLTLMISIILES